MKNKLPYEATSKAIQGYSESTIAKSETNDCVVRAFASAFDVTYDRAHKYVAEKFGRKPKKGTYGTVSKLVKMADDRTTVKYKKVHPVGIRKSSTMVNSLSYNVTIKGEKKVRQILQDNQGCLSNLADIVRKTNRFFADRYLCQQCLVGQGTRPMHDRYHH